MTSEQDKLREQARRAIDDDVCASLLKMADRLAGWRDVPASPKSIEGQQAFSFLDDLEQRSKASAKAKRRDAANGQGFLF